jgi:hypothetical protein
MPNQRLIAACLALLITGGAAHAAEPSLLVTKLILMTNRFVKSLDDEQRAIAVFPFNSDKREIWTFLPGDRLGLNLEKATPEQHELILNIVKTATSAAGWERTEHVRQLEVYLRDVLRSAPETRNPNWYYLTVYGNPSTTGAWGLRYEGHHISLHWTFQDGQVIAAVPQFFGANPYEVTEGDMKGFRLLATQEDLARKLLNSLTNDQARMAFGNGNVPSDILTKWEARVAPLPDDGILYSQLNTEQRQWMLGVLQDALGAQRKEVAKLQWDKLEAAGLENIRFLWIGGKEKGEKHYFRIQGPTFVYEYDNTQNRATHVHSVWRDFEGDFGRDLLREHLRAYHSGSENTRGE